MVFAWNDWNIGHIGRHGVMPDEAEYVIGHASGPYPMSLDSEKRLVVGSTRTGRLLHVVFVWKSPDDLEPASVSPEDLADLGDGQVVFVIHAMPASEKIKRQHRRRKRP